MSWEGHRLLGAQGMATGSLVQLALRVGGTGFDCAPEIPNFLQLSVRTKIVVIELFVAAPVPPCYLKDF